MQERPILSISILVSNQISTIRRCMDSIKPLLENLPCELVAIDTVGEATDGSIDVVREYTDKIYRFEWCNDFAAARNFGMERCRGEWFLFLDDDEWLEDTSELIAFFQGEEHTRYHFGSFHIKNYLADGTYIMGIVGRLIHRKPSTCFVGRVHEHFNEEFVPEKQFQSVLCHSGYAFQNEEERAKKQRRNLEILEQEIKEEGLTPQRAAQMVQELISSRETMGEGYKKCMEYIPEMVRQNQLRNSCTQWLLTASVRCFSKCGKNEQMLRQAQYVMEKYPLTETAQMVLAASVAEVAVEENNRDLVAEYTDLYIKNWDWRMTHEKEAQQQSNLDFPRFYEARYYYHMVHLAAVAANMVKDFRRANGYWKRLPWKDADFDKEKYAFDLNYTLEGLKQEQQTKELKEINALIQVLHEAIVYYKSIMSQENRGEQQELLVGMQEAAISIGTRVDNLFGEDNLIVPLLENFCEWVWQCSQSTEQNAKMEGIHVMEGLLLDVSEKLAASKKNE